MEYTRPQGGRRIEIGHQYNVSRPLSGRSQEAISLEEHNSSVVLPSTKVTEERPFLSYALSQQPSNTQLKHFVFECSCCRLSVRGNSSSDFFISFFMCECVSYLTIKVIKLSQEGAYLLKITSQFVLYYMAATNNSSCISTCSRYGAGCGSSGTCCGCGSSRGGSRRC
jgi:hypothetical protein